MAASEHELEEAGSSSNLFVRKQIRFGVVRSVEL